MNFLKGLNYSLIIPVIVIFLFGLLILFSIDPQLAKSQLVYFIIGLVTFFLVSIIDFQVWLSVVWLLYAFSCLALILTFIIGRATREVHRWFIIGGLSVQSSEFVKPLLILCFSWLVIKFPLKKTKSAAIQFIYFLIPAFLILKQPDLGTSLVILFIWLGVNIAFGLKKEYLLTGGLGILLSTPLLWRLLAEYQRERVLSFLNPMKDPLGSGYHLLQSTIAVGSGQFFGKGLGRGTQSQLLFLPERQSDFIFATLAEEWGFLGCIFLIFLFLVLLLQILKIADSCQDKFGFAVSLGVFLMIFIQVLVNIGMNVGMLPITGITLPLISAGGSSLIATMASLGLVQSAASIQVKKEIFEIK